MPHPCPLFDLRIRTPRLDLLALMAIARAGLHDGPGTPFVVSWDELPSPGLFGERELGPGEWGTP